MPLIITVKIGHESWKVSNGRSAVAHSFTLFENSDFDMPEGALGPDAGGQVFTIPQPEYVNVRLLPLKSDPADAQPIIIPVVANADKGPLESFFKHAPATAKEAMGNNVPSVRCHPLDAGFSFTYNKLQGRTVDRLVLILHDLSAAKLGNMTIQKLYVALSRVRNGKHLAIYPADDNQLKYLSKKTNPPLLQAWDRHYDQNGSWSAEDVILPTVHRLFDKVWVLTNSREGLQMANAPLLKDICKPLGIHFTSLKTLPKMREALAVLWDNYVKRRQP
jgi:hypothetical protein